MGLTVEEGYGDRGIVLCGGDEWVLDEAFVACTMWCYGRDRGLYTGLLIVVCEIIGWCRLKRRVGIVW